MKKLNFVLIVYLTCLLNQNMRAQSSVKVGSNPTTTNSSAQLEIESTTKGLLPPRMTTAQRNAIISPATSLILYNTTANCLQVNDGTPAAPIWICTSGANSSTRGTGEVSSVCGAPCAACSISGTMAQGVAISGVTMTLNVNVTQLGTWSITAGPTNGITFSGSGTFTALGCQAIILTATGTPTTAGATTWTTNTTPSGSATATVAALSPSSGGSAVISAWSGVNGCNVGAGTNNSPAGVMRGGVLNTMVAGISTTDTIQLSATVTTAGTYNITTNTVNGKTFTASGTVSVGAQTITLVSTGAASMAGNHIWALTTTPTINIYGSTITTNAPLGSSYNAHFNGIVSGVSVNFTLATYTSGETFNNNTTCANKPISAQGCGGVTSVTASSGRVHSTVNINGQCWLQTNPITTPTVYNTYTTASWTNTTQDDQGYWGYYHTTVTSGASGWQTTEPAANEGILYQWCGAMDATISERSRGICPSGWHLPSDCEWMYLEHGQGMSLSEQQINNAWRSNTADNQGTPGYKLRSQGTGQTNASGFTGLLAGYRGTGGIFVNRTTSPAWWSSSATGATSAINRDLPTGSRGVGRSNTSKANGFSARCLKD
jgi:uncharacterized protein (TIGR02145 family)